MNVKRIKNALNLTIIISFLTFIAYAVNATEISVPSTHELLVNSSTIETATDINNSGVLKLTSGAINLSGNWLNSGTFNGGTSGTVEFTGLGISTIKGDNSFINFKCIQAGKQLNFEEGKTQIISGAWTLTGALGNLVKLRSTTPGTQWKVDPKGTRNISFVDVKDSNNINATTINPSSSVGEGSTNNNTNWFVISNTTTTTTSTTTSTIPGASTTTISITTSTIPGASTTTTLTTTSTTSTIPVASTTTTSTTTSTIPGATTTTTIPGEETVAPTAEFDADPIGGFVPLEVRFTDKSAERPTSWQWDFGDGNFSSEQNPTNVYKTEGDFTVKLTVTNSAGSNNEVKLGLIAVDPIPPCSAAFNADKTTGFAPLEVNFADKSSGNPTSWQWDFGDGDISEEQNPNHVYQREGIFSVSLSINAACGTGEFTQTNLINVTKKPEPIADFTANPTAGFAPLDVQFNNISTGDPTSFAWEFGDNGSSSEEHPEHTYKTAGIFTVSFVTSNQSGADLETKINLINIQAGEPPTADFSATPLTGFAPLNVQFNDTSAGNIENWTWTFGDGVVSSLQNPNHVYLNAGFYNVKLLVSGSDGIGSENKVNFINVIEGVGPTAAFLAEPLVGNAPFTVHFIDTSSGDISNHIWEFGDGDISIEQNPVHTFKTPGSFNVKLIVSGKNGTSEEIKTGLIEVKDGKSPTAAFIADKNTLDDTDETEELTVSFSDLSSNPLEDDNISREWDFGDNTKGDEKNPEHTYTGKEGETFTVSLTVLNSEGVDTITKPALISLTVADVPGVADLTVSPTSAKKSLRQKNAIVTALNSNDTPVSGVEITATANGNGVKVSPQKAVTDVNGIAEFRFKFGFKSKDGEIIFTADEVSVSIVQEKKSN